MLIAAEKRERTPLAECDSVAREFEVLYARQFNFVWRNLRRWGVPKALIEDAAQDVFVVVHRRLAELQPAASRTAWLFGIALRVARDYRRRRQRKPSLNMDVDTHTSMERGPLERALHGEAVRVLERFLNSLDVDKRTVFVLAELEEMSAPEIGEALNVPVNTVYSRLRIARERFVAFLEVEGEPHGSATSSCEKNHRRGSQDGRPSRRRTEEDLASTASCRRRSHSPASAGHGESF